ncbi:hypothetical protein [Psychrobacter sp. I-STPA6b]|uniref:hypothetical protein n=1 Tax=Psychrobacter sp. I-STPA6b TaxID=2585718 RepID=UPI001D0BFDCE|nr:hypothetical protein [Psychrobacter sp. I-STPA6b]
MQKKDYDARLEAMTDTPSWLLRLVKPDVYHIQLSFNKITATLYKKEGIQQTHDTLADFSNPRLIIADFELSVKVMTDLFRKFNKRNRFVNYIFVDVLEELAGGLTKIEQKAIIEMIMTGAMKAKMQISPPIIAYQGDIVYQGGSRNMM